MRAELPSMSSDPGLIDLAPEQAQPSVFEKPGHAGRERQIRAKGLDKPKQPQNLSYSAPSEVGAAEVSATPQQTVTEDPFAGASRNAECPCGSGKKYKKCHGAPGGPTGLTTRVNG